MADNGVSMGQHRSLGSQARKQCAYEACIRTPLLIRYPGAADHVTGKLVSNIDIAPTIVAIAGPSSRLDPDGKTRCGASTRSWAPLR